MASSALRRSLPHRGSLRSLLPSHPPLPSSPPAAAADATFRRSFQSGGDVESVEEFEKRVLGADDKPDKPFFRNLDGVENFRGRHGGPGMGGFGDRGSMGPGMGGFGDRGNSGGMWGGGDRGNSGSIWGDRGNSGSIWEGLSGSFDSLEDGMDEKLDDAARFFEVSDEVDEEDYEYRPDVNYRRGSSYNVRDLDITRPAAPKNPPRPQFETTTAEVLRKADFRNVRFLSNFLTEAGIIIKRSQTRISAKAQRKVAREIKTARALGLMPFTTMGRRPFIFGRSSVEESHSEEEEGYDFVKQKEGESDEDIVGAEADLGNA